MPPQRRATAEAPVQSVDRALAILELLVEHGALPLSELAARSGLKVTTVHNLLGTLLSRQYVYQTTGRRYAATGKLLELAGSLRHHYQALPLLEEAARALATATRETVFVGRWEGRGYRTIVKVPGTHALVANPQPGGRIHSTAIGKVLLAYAPAADAERCLAEEELVALTPATITDKQALRAELDRVRAAGVACNQGEESMSVYGVAVPVFDWTGAVVAGICIGYPAERDTPAYRVELITLLKAHAREVSASLGYRGSGEGERRLS